MESSPSAQHNCLNPNRCCVVESLISACLIKWSTASEFNLSFDR